MKLLGSLPARFSACISLAVVTASIGGCNPHVEAPPGTPPAQPKVDVVTIHSKPVPLTMELPGRTVAFRISNVEPQVTGLIQRLLFTQGDEVRAGQGLYQIDPATFHAIADSAQASLRKARAAVVSARLNVGRDRSLVKALAVSKQSLDNDVATLDQSEADVSSAQASIESANINLAYTTVTSPITGRASRSSVTEGALVNADQTTPLVTVTQLNPIYVDVTQPIPTLLRLKQALKSGQLKSAGYDAAVVHLILDDGSEYQMAGRLQFSEVTVDEETGSVTLRAVFPNPDELLLPGMFVRARIQEGVSLHGLLVPQRDVTHNEQGQPTALVVGPGNKVEGRILVADRAIGTNWLVTSGIADGDRVIVAGLQKVRAGMVVDPVQAAAVTGDSGGQGTAGN
jgi:membrane fusion protein (multidrug efflux system)